VFTRPLSELCARIFTGIPPRSRVDTLPGALTLPIVGIKALTHAGTIDHVALETLGVAGGPRPSQESICKNDVLLSIRGNMPKCALVQDDFAEPTYASGNLAVLRPDSEKIDPSYLWTVMMRVCRDAHHPLLTRATTQQLSIRVGSLYNLAVPLPPLPEQHLIGETALALRDAITAERCALEAGEKTFNAFLIELPTS
jgi:hypothetical protein